MKVNIGPYPKKAQRRVSVEISRSDTFSMDGTLAYVVLPMLIQLKQTKHGIPHDFAEVGGEDYQAQDSFDFYKWARQAFGLTGLLIGWTTYFKAKVPECATST